MNGGIVFRIEGVRAAPRHLYNNQVAPRAACVRPCFTVTVSDTYDWAWA
jgi:hypothetical protein